MPFVRCNKNKITETTCDEGAATKEKKETKVPISQPVEAVVNTHPGMTESPFRPHPTLAQAEG